MNGSDREHYRHPVLFSSSDCTTTKLAWMCSDRNWHLPTSNTAHLYKVQKVVYLKYGPIKTVIADIFFIYSEVAEDE